MLSIQNISFSYLKYKTITSFSCDLEVGKTLAIIGESGCGKSTLLKLIYGLYDLDEGHIFWKNKKILGPKNHLIPGMDYMKYLAQDFDLMPFITVAENVGKYLSNFFPEEKQARINKLLEIVEMAEFSATKAKLLSGGQMQRVALARVLALEPEILLLDEPFSHIDTARKNNLRRNIFNYAKEKNITCIISSHDIEDSLSFSDKIIILKKGKIIAEGNPKELFEAKENIEVAKLFGTVNQISKNYFGLKSLDQILVYSFELKVVEKSSLQVKVIKAYFKGKNYLVEAKYKEGVLYFESETDLIPNSIFYLNLTKLPNS